MELTINIIIFAIIIWIFCKYFIRDFPQKNKIINSIKAKITAHRIPDEAYFEMAAAEVARGAIKPGLWAKAVSDALGDEKKAGALYTKFRVQAMREEAASAIFQAQGYGSRSIDSNSADPNFSCKKKVLPCPQCTKRLRVDAGKLLDVTCPHCKNGFRTQT